MQRCSPCYGRYRLVALHKYSPLQMLVEKEIGSGSYQRSLEQPEMSPLSPSCFWTFATVGCSESAISLPSDVTSGSLLRLLKFLPVFKFASLLRSWLCSDAESISLLRKAVIVAGHRALSLCPRGCQSCSDFSQRKASALSCSTQRISRLLLVFGVFQSSVTAQEELVCTKGYPCSRCSQPISSLLTKACRDVARSNCAFFFITFIFISKCSP